MFLNGIGFDNGRKIVNYKNVGKTPSITIPKPQEEEDQESFIYFRPKCVSFLELRLKQASRAGLFPFYW